jgi:PST family polysaccharide transporter
VTSLSTGPPSSADAKATIDLDRSVVRGVAWTGVAKWSTQLVSWVSTLLVARLLTPADYGLVGMAMVYIGLAQLVNEFGLAAPIIQQRTLTTDQLARLGGLAVLVGVALCAFSIGFAGVLAGFFGEPAVQNVVIVLSLAFVARSLHVLPRALLVREMRFPRLAIVDVVEAVALVSLTLTLAFLGAGYWALVLGSLGSACAAAAALLVVRPHRLAFPRRFRSLTAPIRVGWQVSVSHVAWYTYANADFAIVGRVLGTVALGAYSIGWYVASVPVERVSALLARVAPSIFAATQDRPQATGRYLLGLTEGLAFITFPASIGLALVADEFVRVLLGPQWEAAIVPLRLLTLYAGLRSIMTLPPQLLTMTGHARLTMWYSIVAALILPLLFLAGTTWGTTGVAVAWIVGYPLVALPTFLRQALRVVGLPARAYLRALWPALSATLIMAAAVLAVRATTATTGVVSLALHVGTGAVTYAGAILLLHRDRVGRFRELIRMARS